MTCNVSARFVAPKTETRHTTLIVPASTVPRTTPISTAGLVMN